MSNPFKLAPLVLATCASVILGGNSAEAQALFGADCHVVSRGFWENGAPISTPVEGEEDAYRLAYFPDGFVATYQGHMDSFVNCTSVGDILRCNEINRSVALEPPNPDVLKTIELNRKTGAFQAVVWLKSRPTVRRESVGTCVFDQ